MDKSLKYYLGGVVAIILLIVLIDSFKAKPIIWYPTFSLDTKNPFDLYVLNEELEELFPTSPVERITETPYEYIDTMSGGPRNYLIINYQMSDIYSNIWDVLNVVKEGSHLFVSSSSYVAELLDSLEVSYQEVDKAYAVSGDNAMNLSLTNASSRNATYSFPQVLNTKAFTAFNPLTTTILGTQTLPDGLSVPNFIRVKHGQGYVYLSCQPKVFTNVALLDSNSSAAYAQSLLSYLPADRPLVWFVKTQMSTEVKSAKTSLSVVFKYPALRAVWLLLIYGLLLYILFNVKRYQRVIPIVKPLKNTTVEFVQTIANLYFQEENIASAVMRKKIFFFLDKVRTRYFLETNLLDDHFVDKLSKKSGKDDVLIKEIVKRINDFKRIGTVIDSDLLRFNELLDEFWRK